MIASSLPDILKIGTRGSPLALAQAHEAADRLQNIVPGLKTDIVVIKTTGRPGTRPATVGNRWKGLFSKELDIAQTDGRVDIAVHSVKDLETWMPDGIILGAFLPREDVRDALIAPNAGKLSDLPEGAVVGTSSLRRQAQLLAARPDLTVISFRGNVQTRLRKLSEGEADATMLAMAGLNRMDMANVATQPLEPEEMLPAVAQGAIGITAHERSVGVLELLSELSDTETEVRVSAERAFLAELDGSCRTPIAGLMQTDGDEARFRGLVARPDGSGMMTVERTGTRSDCMELAVDAGKFLAKDMDDSYRP